MARTFLDEGTLAVGWKEGGTPVLPLDFDAITTTEWATGTDISAQLVVGSSNFNFTDPDTIDEKSWEDKGKTQTPTNDNFEVSMTMFRDRDETGLLLPTDPLNVFGHREIWYFAIRPGRPKDVAPAAGQDYTYFRVMISKRNPLTNPNGETEKIEIGTLPQGDSGNGTIAAGA